MTLMKVHVFLMAAALLPALSAPSVIAQDQAAAEIQQKERPQTDPTEAADFANARRVADPARRAEALEAFVQHHPNSGQRIDALVGAMAAHQQAGNAAKAGELAKRVLEADAQNVRALYVYVAQARAAGDQAPDDARDLAMQGLLALNAWQKPEDMTDAEYTNLHREMTATFTSAIAYFAMLGRDLATARMYYQQALAMNSTSLEETYCMGLVEIEMHDPAGFWYIARAIHLAKAARNSSDLFMANYGRLKYAEFHGSMEGWADIVKNAATQTTMPDDFTVAPSGAEADNP
jgi:hypothetical protein